MRKFAGTSKKFGGQDPWLSGEKKNPSGSSSLRGLLLCCAGF
jgi:hypothetical protein